MGFLSDKSTWKNKNDVKPSSMRKSEGQERTANKVDRYATSLCCRHDIIEALITTRIVRQEGMSRCGQCQESIHIRILGEISNVRKIVLWKHTSNSP